MKAKLTIRAVAKKNTFLISYEFRGFASKNRESFQKCCKRDIFFTFAKKYSYVMLPLVKNDPWLNPVSKLVDNRHNRYEQRLNGIKNRYGSLMTFATAHQFLGLNYDKRPINFGLVITLKELNGQNRLSEFIHLCSLRGWLVNRINIENQIDVFNKAEQDVEFE